LGQFPDISPREALRTQWENLKKGNSGSLNYYTSEFARRANFAHLETLGFGYSSRQDANNAKFGNLFYFAPLRLCGRCSDSFWLRRSRAKFSAVNLSKVLPRHAFAQHLIQQGFIDELSGIDRLIDFLRDAGGVNQELVAFDAIFAVWAKQLQ